MALCNLSKLAGFASKVSRCAEICSLERSNLDADLCSRTFCRYHYSEIWGQFEKVASF